MELFGFIVTVILITASGALAPGPLFFATVSQGTKTGAKGGLIFSISHTFVEFTLIMLLALGLLTIASTTIVKNVIGIVGGIVIGQAAVEAGIVSNIMVIVVALTAIASFIIPNYEMGSAIRIIRFPMMILASLFGFVGIIVGLMILLSHFIGLESLGMPYGSPVAPLRIPDWKDLFVRFPQWSLEKRPFNTRAVQMKRANTRHPKGDEES